MRRQVVEIDYQTAEKELEVDKVEEKNKEYITTLKELASKTVVLNQDYDKLT